MDLYADNILEHYRDPRNKRKDPHSDMPEGGPRVSHEEENPACGDQLTVHVWIEGNSIKKIEWEGTGCAISQAAMSMLSEEISGMQTDAVLALSKDDVYALLGVPVGPRRFKCALLGLHTLKNAMRKYKGESAQGWVETVGLLL